MCEAVPPLSNTPSWRGAQLGGAREQLYFYLLYFTLVAIGENCTVHRYKIGGAHCTNGRMHTRFLLENPKEGGHLHPYLKGIGCGAVK
jgi:hypothetical protein